MILHIQQTKTNFAMQWVVKKKNGDAFAVCNSPFENGQFSVSIDYNGMFSEQKMIYNPMDTTYGTKLKDRMSFKIFDGANLVGTIIGATEKTGFLKAIAFYEIILSGKKYRGYEVGLGAKGLYLCIYDDKDQLVSIVQKNAVTINFKDSYVAYITNDKPCANMVIPFVLYYDVTVFGDIMERAVGSAKQSFATTVQKEVLTKFNPDFIASIKKADGVDE